jgi:hypothetical protein
MRGEAFFFLATLGFELKVLCHLSHSTSPLFMLGIFEEDLSNYLSGAGFEQ